MLWRSKYTIFEVLIKVKYTVNTNFAILSNQSIARRNVLMICPNIGNQYEVFVDIYVHILWDNISVEQ